MPALIYGIEAWGYIKKEEMKEIDRIKGILKLPVSTAYTGILMETGIWPAEQRIQYATLMLYHNIKNSDEERKIKKMIEEQEKKNHNNTFYKKVQQIAKTLEIEIDKVTGKKINMEKTSEWESDIKGKKENEWRDGKKNKLLNNGKWQVGKKGIHKRKQ